MALKPGADDGVPRYGRHRWNHCRRRSCPGPDTGSILGFHAKLGNGGFGLGPRCRYGSGPLRQRPRSPNFFTCGIRRPVNRVGRSRGRRDRNFRVRPHPADCEMRLVPASDVSENCPRLTMHPMEVHSGPARNSLGPERPVRQWYGMTHRPAATPRRRRRTVHEQISRKNRRA